MDAKVFHSMTYGLYVLGVKTREQVGGCVVNTLFQVTSEPAVFAVCVNTQNNTCGLIEKAGLFTASVLTEDCPSETIGLYGFKSSRDVDKSSGMVLIFVVICLIMPIWSSPYVSSCTWAPTTCSLRV